MNAMAAKRRHPATLAVVLFLGLLVTGGVYTLFAPKQAGASVVSADTVEEGKKLFLANCSTCHGQSAVGTKDGPSLVGVGAAAVDFQVSSGRMPLASPNVQAPRIDRIMYTQEQIEAMAAYIASLAPGPAIPDKYITAAEGKDPAKGGEIYRVNCAMCHNTAGAGGALTRGKYAPSLNGPEVTGKRIYEAMLTGPQSMPVFSDVNIPPEEKANVIAFLEKIRTQPNEGGMNLGNMGPVSEGLFVWIFGLGILIICAVWLGKKAA